MATVLEITQSILNLMDGDNVNSISDTTESEQVATLIKECFDDIVDRYELTAAKITFQLNALADTTHPTHFNIPDGVLSIEWVAYDTREDAGDSARFTPILYKTPAEFMDIVSQRDSTDTTNVLTVDLIPNPVPIYIYKTQTPQYYTTFDDAQIIFDAFDNSVDTTMQATKTNCYGEKQLIITVDDTTAIPLPQNLIALLKKESLELAFDIWKEGAPQRIVRDANKARVKAQRRKHRLNINQERDQLTGPNYGRRV